jgi:hypothetical protein
MKKEKADRNWFGARFHFWNREEKRGMESDNYAKSLFN